MGSVFRPFILFLSKNAHSRKYIYVKREWNIVQIFSFYLRTRTRIPDKYMWCEKIRKCRLYFLSFHFTFKRGRKFWLICLIKREYAFPNISLYFQTRMHVSSNIIRNESERNISSIITLKWQCVFLTNIFEAKKYIPYHFILSTSEKTCFWVIIWRKYEWNTLTLNFYENACFQRILRRGE